MKDFLVARPLIYIPTHIANARAKQKELTNEGVCRKCNRPYQWVIREAQQFEKASTEKEDNFTRAKMLFDEYRNKHICPACASNDHNPYNGQDNRNFICKTIGGVTYKIGKPGEQFIKEV
jgi:hypothetical protein